MKIGLVKEIKSGELRVCSTPENIKKLVDAGHEVVVEAGAGLGCAFSDQEYIDAGASITDQDGVWDVDMLIKVKEPLESEYKYFKKGLIVWGFLHLAASKACVEAMMAAGTTAISGETIEVNGVLKLLQPMSAIAGRRAVFMGAYYLEAQHEGEGLLISGIEGIEGGEVVIFGGGNAAINSAEMAIGIGANVTVIEKSLDRIKWINENYPSVKTVESTAESLAEEIKKADIFISTILIPGEKPPKLVTEEMVKTMKKGSVIIDISIDQGGTVETIDHSTYHDNPVFIKHGVLHYAVPNMPAAVPKTATMALAKGNIEYLLAIAENGANAAIKADSELATGVNLYEGKVTHAGLADTLGLEHTNIEEVL